MEGGSQGTRPRVFRGRRVERVFRDQTPPSSGVGGGGTSLQGADPHVFTGGGLERVSRNEIPASSGVGSSTSIRKGLFSGAGHGGGLTRGARRGGGRREVGAQPHVGGPAAGAPPSADGMPPSPGWRHPLASLGPALQGRLLCRSSHLGVFCCSPTGVLSGAPAHKPAPTSQSHVATR